MMLANERYEAICNLCGLSCALGAGGSPAHGNHGLIDAQVTGGYESTPGNGCGALDDLVRYRFSICEFCLDWLFSRFRVPVAVDDPMDDYLLQPGENIDAGLTARGIVQLVPRGDTPAWRPAWQRVNEDDWRKQKEEFFAEAERRYIARKDES